MRKLTLLFASILLASTAISQDDLEILDDDPFAELGIPPVLQEPAKKPKAIKQEFRTSADHYCLCKCIKKGESLAKAKFFKGRNTGDRGCICECAVK